MGTVRATARPVEGSMGPGLAMPGVLALTAWNALSMDAHRRRLPGAGAPSIGCVGGIMATLYIQVRAISQLRNASGGRSTALAHAGYGLARAAAMATARSRSRARARSAPIDTATSWRKALSRKVRWSCIHAIAPSASTQHISLSAARATTQPIQHGRHDVRVAPTTVRRNSQKDRFLRCVRDMHAAASARGNSLRFTALAAPSSASSSRERVGATSSGRLV